MGERTVAFADWFIPDGVTKGDADRLMARTFVGLHFLGPLMGHSVTYFLAVNGAAQSWQFWVLEALVAGFFFIPLIIKATGSLRLAAMASTQMLVFLSLFGAFFFGGMASPFLPWFLIAMILGFFFLADHVTSFLVGIFLQIATFIVGWLVYGGFPELLPIESLTNANLLSIGAALAYMTLLSLYYEAVMRLNADLELETGEQRNRLSDLRAAMSTAQNASMRKSIFLAKMSHELRTPLNAVIGYSELLIDNFEDSRADHKVKDLERIRSAGRHLLALVNNVIDLSSIEADRAEIDVRPTDIRNLVDEVVATAAPLVAKRQNRLEVKIDPRIGTASVDPLKLKQSLLNLLSNAAKFTTRGTIECSVQLKTSAGRNYLSFEIADDGIGISDEGVKRLFSDFAQAEDDTSSRFGGTGLGLALTHRFCEMMGGDIAVQSERGIGTIFTIRIPVSSAAGTKAGARAA